MPTRDRYYEQLEECSQATRNAIYHRLKDRGGVRGLQFPTSRDLATALVRVKDGKAILAEERALSDDPESEAALNRLDDLGDGLEE